MRAERNKGQSILDFPDDFTVMDIETTGLSAEYCEIIEVAAIRMRDNRVVDQFNSLIKPTEPIAPFVEALSGITNDMLKDQAPIEIVLPQFVDFIGGDVLVGHNVNFDINFIYDYLMNICGEHFTNHFIDTMRISRRLHSEERHHRLVDILQRYGLPCGIRMHRAMNDCKYTLAVLYEMKKEVLARFDSVPEFFERHRKNTSSLDLRSIKAETDNIDTMNPLYKQNCVFTGALSEFTRVQAAQLVADMGGFCLNGVTKQTNFLIVGNMDYKKNMEGNKTAKMKKAEKLISEGADLQILSEDVFIDMISQ